jgi:glucose/arabinose dehydrogenase/plastocyanin
MEEMPSASFEPVIGLELVAEGLAAPLALMPSGNGNGQHFIIDQTGQIWILSPEGALMEEPFLDVSDRMVALETSYDERGLLGLAFHPDFAQNGRFYIYYSAPLREGAPSGWDHTSHLSEFVASAAEPNKADADSERILMQIDQPQSNHNAGQIAFGPDGYLYVPLGDGGGANDVGTGHNPDIGNGQDTSVLLGSILRIDVDGGDPYGIPSDNPFMGEKGREEIFAYGFRNPYRISFDAGGNHYLFVGDAGQDRWEEVDIVMVGNNYGWNIKEGTHCFDPENPGTPPEECPDTGPLGEPLVDPVIEYQNANAPDGLGLVVVGGMVYRGDALPAFQGRYIFGDWSTSFGQPDGTLLVATPAEMAGEMWSFEELRIAPATREDGRLGSYLLSLGQDADLELYVLTSDTAGPSGDTGKVFKIVPPAEEEEETGVTSSITVMDQPLTDNTIAVDEVVSDGPGWLVIHADENGAPGPVIGYSEVMSGTNMDISVELDLTGLTGTLYAMLHQDTGEMGTYEFPDADPPVTVEGEVVVVPFDVPVMEEETTVEMVDTTFDPDFLVVRSGTMVTWVNRDGVQHNTVSDDGVWESDLLGQDESFDYAFEEVGVYPYYCEPHGGPDGTGMSGTIVVVP